METTRLVKRAKKGDKEALLALIMNKKTDLYRLAFVYLKNPDDAQDALEDMIVTVYENIHTLRKNSAFHSWCRQILVNKCKRKLESGKRIVLTDAIDSQVDGGIALADDQMTLDYYLNQIPELHRDVIRLKYLMDYDLKTIAGVLDIPVGTVKSRLSNGMKQLREVAKEGDNE